jgi:hypothetical protein
MNLALDSSIILRRRTYLFEYKSVRFKLVQTHYREYHDHLLTVVRDINDTAAMDRAFAVGAELVSALAWEQDAPGRFAGAIDDAAEPVRHCEEQETHARDENDGADGDLKDRQEIGKLHDGGDPLVLVAAFGEGSEGEIPGATSYVQPLCSERG